jgi:hypothetical protein
MPLGIGSPLKERAISLSVLCVVHIKHKTSMCPYESLVIIATGNFKKEN